MTKFLITVSILFLTSLAQAADISGTWKGDKGGTFYVSQDRGRVYWYGEQLTRNPYWAHVFVGKIDNKDNEIRGDWFDVPKGKKRERGGLRAEVSDDGNNIEIMSQNFVATKLRKVRQNVAATSPGASVQAAPMVLKEDCITFNPGRVRVSKGNGNWKIVEGSNWLFDFAQSKSEADKALSVIRQYKMDSVCYVGRPQPSFTYLLSNGQSPLGKKVQEDCLTFNPKKLKLEQVHGSWKIVEGNHWLFDFGSNIQEAKQSLSIIRKYQFKYSCFIGRPDPSFTYMRQ